MCAPLGLTVPWLPRRCLLLFTGEARGPKEAIALIRKRRCKQAVETRRQEDFVKRYWRYLVETGVVDAPPQKERAQRAGEEGRAQAGLGRAAGTERAEGRERLRAERREARAAKGPGARPALTAAAAAGCSRSAGCRCPLCAASEAAAAAPIAHTKS